MNPKFIAWFAVLFLLYQSIALSQEADSIEVYLIDAYSTTEIPYTFKFSFYTSNFCKTTIVLENKYDFDVSTEPTDLHKGAIDLSDLSFDDRVVNFVVVSEDSSGNTFTSEVFDFDLPYEPEIKEGSDFLTICLFGGTIFLLPYPNYVFEKDKSYFSLTKEIPLVSFRSRSLKYPSGFLSIEYTYIFDTNKGNYLRAGYKKIFDVPYIEYISPGVSVYTNFSGNNGVSPEVSFGLFTLLDTFTLYTRYRYNIKPGDSNGNFQEIMIGLYSGFFSFYLD